ncbi:basic proline-rich protein-like [Perognathus longimembris pacificus]|uniref:basic proline-rich protein-like n=1 Tax=Perognathus longimembris pacificus TaxID=214514 RepID=UPI002019C8A2|nr:basic proline-rich protein-like [Perognathus longimembris pacificus]
MAAGSSFGEPPGRPREPWRGERGGAGRTRRARTPGSRLGKLRGGDQVRAAPPTPPPARHVRPPRRPLTASRGAQVPEGGAPLPGRARDSRRPFPAFSCPGSPPPPLPLPPPPCRGAPERRFGVVVSLGRRDWTSVLPEEEVEEEEGAAEDSLRIPPPPPTPLPPSGSVTPRGAPGAARPPCPVPPPPSPPGGG